MKTMEADEIRMDISSAEGFESEVRTEIAHEERLLQRVNRSHRGYIRSYIMAAVLLTLIVLIIFAKPEAILVWLIAAFILYSFNFIILFLPTTRKDKDPDARRRSFHVRDAFLPAWMLLRQKRRLAIEIGITIFLGGMAPLAASFFIIFGIGLFFALYFGLITGALDPVITQSIVVQIVFIIFFFIMMLILEPHSQGFSRIASAFGVKIRAAHIKSQSAFVAIMALAGIVIAIVAILFIGAMLLTGGMLSQLFTAEEDLRNVFLFALLIGIQIMVMRHFQAVSSRRMARVMLKERLDMLKMDVLQPLEVVIARVKNRALDEKDNERMDELKRLFFSIATYDLFELNFFGYSPIYVVGPKVKYILDPKIIPYLGMFED
jgi:hypothetical protein